MRSFGDSMGEHGGIWLPCRHADVSRLGVWNLHVVVRAYRASEIVSGVSVISHVGKPSSYLDHLQQPFVPGIRIRRS
jgi:hypothetical protein